MLSKKKLTFSLTYLVMLIAVGFAMGLIVAPDAIADEVKDMVVAAGAKITFDPAHPKPTLSVSDADDVSSAEGAQVERPSQDDDSIVISIDFDTLVNVLPDAADAAEATASATGFDITDISITAYNEDGVPVTAPALNVANASSALARGNPNTGKNAVLTINFDAVADAAAWTAIDALYVSVPEKKFINADLTLGPEASAHAVNVRSDVLKIELVADEDGDAKYNKYGETNSVGTGTGAGTPGVVSITRALGATGFASAVTGPFDVRIILTEEPAAFDASHIIVENGTASAPVAGSPIAAADLTSVYAGGGWGVDGNLPDATGRDDEYHQYLVTITPTAGHVGDVTITVAQFEDMEKPVSKEYVPLLKSQRLNTETDANRDLRITEGREVLTVEANTAEDAKVAAAKAAYDARQKILDANSPTLKPLDAKKIIPAGGYLVLVADLGKAGIADPGGRNLDKKTETQLLYNTAGLGLPFPASDLSNFFRNGGTLNLVYQDITAATDSGHDESKGPTGDDATNYTAASTNPYAAGAVIISEIMWGLDKDTTDAQYIELHNPGTADIGIDIREWAISVGAAPAGFTVIDTVGNNPATGYWQVPGTDGASTVEASAGFFTLVDIVSMSRIGDDGTAAASWAASMRPSDNLGGRRIGTPGAANVYVMPAAAADAPAEPVTPAAAVATADDLMISEIMVASNDGRLPQWIEIANVSAAAVSVSGWSLEVENDADDVDVVGRSVGIDLGDVEIGAGQVALVISKESARNSGVGVGEGDLRADRIIDAQSQASPTNARYSLISEMGFMISLMPPQTGAVRTYGDVVGNLDGGWELPASEDGRSSLIRRDAGEATGTDAAGWVLASDTLLNGAYRATFYGSDEDMGTPGFDAGGALPVELSGFNAARDRVTGAVVITWSTQSELNNAGFFIKRSQQQKGKFVVVNPTMISGAGTTAEKQSYTYTDATADPNIVYYYQIEDVSLDGNRQTLTRASRLKGHIGAAGKVTTTWGELKSSRE